MIQRSRTALAYECSICGHKVIVDYNLGQRPPEECEKCGRTHEEEYEDDPRQVGYPSAAAWATFGLAQSGKQEGQD